MKNCLLVCLLFHGFNAAAQNNDNPAIDIQHYTFSLWLNDANDTIKGEAGVKVLFLQSATAFNLDLVKTNGSGKGMQVTGVFENNRSLDFRQEDAFIHIPTTARRGDTIYYSIRYQGIPADGLIIGKNKYGHRVFFGDNWPNRAHNWLPCIDNPADKASVDFIVTAPDHYQIISNGVQTEENNLPNQLRQTHWSETVALPTKVMVIGAADFAVNYVGDTNCIPVYSWVYPEDKDKGFYDYALAKEILPFFIARVGPYAYRKLANVQSTTRFGGMENASAIFYFEKSVQGDRKTEALLAHEIAHQWFGNSVTEKRWSQVWLSEGFATYMTHLYLENKYGRDTLRTRLEEDHKAVIQFSTKRNTPVVDTSVTSNFLQLLNNNSYQKGGWVLHMLRRKLGDSIFWQGIRDYYARYAGRNASTEDFRKQMETTSGLDLRQFFEQWLFTAGQPMLHTSWKYDEKKQSLLITIEQRQENIFRFPLQVLVESGNKKEIKTIEIKDKTTEWKVDGVLKPFKIVVDPETNLLFEEVPADQNP